MQGTIGDPIRQALDADPGVLAVEYAAQSCEVWPRRYAETTNGDDAVDGFSPDFAWETIAKVNGETFRPTDHILFKRGETWAETLTPASSGIAGKHIVFDAYGSGVKPILDGSALDAALSIADSTHHHLTFKNLWFSGAIGANKETVRCRSHDVNFYQCDISDSDAYLGFAAWSATGATIYNIILDGCRFFDNSKSGAFVGSDDGTLGPKNVLFINCQAYDNGVSDVLDHGIYVKYGCTVRSCTTYSNTASGIQAENNSVVGAYTPVIDKCMSYSNNRGYNIIHNGVVMTNCIGYNNVDENLYMLVRTLGCEFYHNTMVNSQSRPSMIYDGDCPVGANNIFENNIFCQDVVVFNERCFRTDDVANLASRNTFDNNSYWQAGNAGDNIGPGVTLAQWQALGGSPDPNGIITDMAFVTEWTDFHLLVGSPCRGAGAVGTGVTDDYDGVTRGSPPDIGALEYVA